MFELLLSIFCAYRNGLLAKQKGQNTVVWGLITIILFFIASGIGGAILISILYRGPISITALNEFVIARPILGVTVTFFGLGGYLLTRYILEKMKSTNKEGE